MCRVLACTEDCLAAELVNLKLAWLIDVACGGDDLIVSINF